MMTLETDRLILRNFQIDDWQVLREMIIQYEASGLAIYDHPWPTAPDEIRRISKWFSSGDSYIAVCLKDTQRFIGFVSLNCDKEDTRAYDLGYVFSFDFHGQGYATEACRAVIDRAFEQLGAQQLLVGTSAKNHASCRLLERMGFRKTSETPTSFQNAPDGEPIIFPGCLYALSREEWRASTCRRVRDSTAPAP